MSWRHLHAKQLGDKAATQSSQVRAKQARPDVAQSKYSYRIEQIRSIFRTQLSQCGDVMSAFSKPKQASISALKVNQIGRQKVGNMINTDRTEPPKDEHKLVLIGKQFPSRMDRRVCALLLPKRYNVQKKKKKIEAGQLHANTT